MLTRPEEVDDRDLVDVLRGSWGVVATRLTYRAVGFGSHHWAVQAAGGQRLFLTVDDLDAKRSHADEPRDAARARLHAALRTARRLQERGLEFVVAPIPTADGQVASAVGERFAAALYPHVEGASHSHGSYTDVERGEVLGLLARLHAAEPTAVPEAGRETFAVPNRTTLLAALDELDQRWDAGPFGERTRQLAQARADDIHALLVRYDALVRSAGHTDDVVVTHGEPHRANTMTTANGLVLIDWDTALLAPPERDLWMAIEDGVGPFAVEQLEATGRRVDPRRLELYRMRWALAEIAGYIGYFRAAHGDTADAAESWANLTHYTDL